MFEATIEIKIRYNASGLEKAQRLANDLAEAADDLLVDTGNSPFLHDCGHLTQWHISTSVKTGNGLETAQGPKTDWQLTRKEMEKAVLRAVETWDKDRLVDYVRGCLQAQMKVDTFNTVQELFALEVLGVPPEEK